MERRPWRDRVAAELARRGVPVGWRRRLLRELADHIDDLTDEGEAMTDATLEAKLGRPDVLAAHAADQYRRAGWAARRPWLAFGLLPVPAVLAAMVGSLIGLQLLAAGMVYLGGWDADALPRSTTVIVVFVLHNAVRFLPFVLAAAWVGRLAARHRVGRVWAAVGVGQVALLAAAFVSRVVLRDEPGESMWMMGFSLPPFDPSAVDPALGAFFLPFGWSQVGQAAAVLVAAGWMMRRVRRQQLAIA
ncbi:MAG: hypothetical protein U0871_13465 [Gemmataceae bacterium]